MEYSRRRKRRKRNQVRPSGDVGRAVAALLMIAAIVYLVSASAAGTWIAKNVMAPVFEAAASLGAEASPNVPSDAESSAPVSLSDSGSAVSLEISLPALTCHMLQMGVYSDRANADAQSSSLRALGAGGFILEDGDRYRVMAAGYSSEADAKQVKERLVDEGIDCTVYTASSQAATFKVTASAEQLDDVKRGFSAIADAQAALCEEALSFDRDGREVDEGKASAGAILSALESDMALLCGYDGENAMLSSLLACYERCRGAISALASSAAATTPEFSSELKHATLEVTAQYMALIDSFS